MVGTTGLEPVTLCSPADALPAELCSRMVGATGLEPAASCSHNRCAVKIDNEVYIALISFLIPLWKAVFLLLFYFLAAFLGWDTQSIKFALIKQKSREVLINLSKTKND